MSNFWNLPDETRFRAYEAIKLSGCQTHDGGGNPALTVAVARGRLGDLISGTRDCGLKLHTLYKFPLGTSQPGEHLRHDSRGIPASAWLLASFLPE